ncbi:MAG: glutamate--tRNA ligase [Deltaproteobacteria bacterium]|nr:glutamate--tRNA ligase [Deltaproteobacteria bacterium]
MTVRVRFAPSPTGHLHIGGARTALYNWLFAQRQGGIFILRIEDTDTERSTQEYTQSILDGMHWLGLTWDEGPFHQMERMPIYREHVDRLLAEGKAYRCYCTAEELEAKRKAALAAGRKPTYDRTCRGNGEGARGKEPYCIRFAAPIEGTTIVRDLIRGEIPIANKELDDLIILRSDGTPTYNFTVVVDDVTMRITHVVRGDDHLNNTPRQILIYQALAYPTPLFAHLPMILGAVKQRLSKRHGATSVIAYRDAGYLPEALLNYLARLGWSHGDQEIFTLREMVEHFSLEHVGKAPAVFDPEKLNWVNHEHLKKYTNEQLVDLARPFLATLGLSVTDRAYAARALASERERAKTLKELAEVAAFYFREEIPFDEAAARKWLTPEKQALLKEIADGLTTAPTFTEAEIKARIEAIRQTHGLKMVDIAQPIRVALTGTTVSPGIFEVMHILGRDRVLARLARCRTLFAHLSTSA